MRSDRLTNQTLTVFLGAVLNKRYTNPSSDIISVLAGLHDADAVISDFVTALDTTIRNGRNSTLAEFILLVMSTAHADVVPLRQKAVRAALAMVSGAYSTGLVTYFMHRDLFPALMKVLILRPNLMASLTVCSLFKTQTTASRI
jgi:hypothetical protein